VARRRRLLLCVATGIVLSASGSVAAAATHRAHARHRRAHHLIAGLVLSRLADTQASVARTRPTNNLIFHGGPVLPTNSTYSIYWSPANYPVASSYETVINQFFGDVATATTAGATSNVFYAATQYGKGITGSSAVTLGSMPNTSTFGGGYVDTNPLPASGCKDPYTAVCVTDAQIQAEIHKDITAAGWTAGSGKIFFMFTPNGVGSCIASGSSQCSYSYFCAYHSNIGTGSAAVLYANMPFADTVRAACDAGYHPNSSVDASADPTISVTSHEFNETVTDPFGTAWWDRSGNEDGDKCAWNFGALLGGSGATGYNQVINGHRYITQQEWSNRSSRCVLTGV